MKRVDGLLVGAFLSSGVAALGLELIWVRVLGLAFGSESFGMLGVLAAFFGGLALGSAALQRVTVRSTRPVRLYVAAEIGIAAYALAGPNLMLRLADAMPRVIGPIVGDNSSLAALAVNLIIGMIVLLPATFCMGATTVAVVEAWRRRRTADQNATTVAWLYASNTFGATVGILLSTYWLMPSAGIQTASRVLALFSLAAAAMAWLWERVAPAAPAVATELQRPARVSWTPLLYGLLFFTGLAGVGLETVGTHALSQILENTVYTFANVLAVYLLGTAVGAWLYTVGPVRRYFGDRDRCTRVLLYALAASGIAAAAMLAHAGTMMAALTPVSASYPRLLAVQTMVIALIFFPPTICMGATFSHLVGHFTGSGVGYAAAVNTAGATLAPFVFGLVLIPSAGYGTAFYSAIGIYLILFAAAHLWHRQGAWSAVTGCSLAAAAVALTYSPLLLIRLPSNVVVLEQRIGLHGVVSVTELTGPGAPISPPRYLQVDQSYYMGATPGGVEKRMGQLAIFLTRAPRNVLYLGIGTGITASAALDDGVARVTAVDLLPEIVDVLPWFEPFNSGLQRNPRATVRAADARRFIRATGETYDAISADLFHPSRDGTASLYTREHFLAVRGRLRDGGVFVQWLPIYQMAPRDLKTIVRTFLEVFPDGDSALSSYSAHAGFGLIGHAPGGRARTGVDVLQAEGLLARSHGAAGVFDGLKDLLGLYMLDAQGLRHYAGAGPINTDDNQRITFDAARAARIQDSRDFYRPLESLLPYRRPFPDAFIAASGPEGLAGLRRAVAAYGDAGTDYLDAEIALLREPEDGVLSPAALEEYLKAYRDDVRYTSAPRRLLGLALQYPGATKTIVERLWQEHPEQAEISALHQRLANVTDPGQVQLIVRSFLQTGLR